MSRLQLALGALLALLIVVLWFMLVWSPTSDELAAVEDEIVRVETERQTASTRLAALKGVREEAAEAQARLAAAQSVVPEDPALPSALRQLQLAADESGATLVSVSPERPAPVDAEGQSALHALGLNVELRGSYFQIVDVLRRLEDPAISPRGVVWSEASLSSDEYPELVVTLSGRMYSVLGDSLSAPGDDAAPPDDPGAADGTEPLDPTQEPDGAEGADAPTDGGTTDAPPAGSDDGTAEVIN